MNYSIEWKAVRAALSYTGKVTESDIMHATDRQNVKPIITRFLREGKLKQNFGGTYSHAAKTKTVMTNAGEKIRESVFNNFKPTDDGEPNIKGLDLL